MISSGPRDDCSGDEPTGTVLEEQDKKLAARSGQRMASMQSIKRV